MRLGLGTAQFGSAYGISNAGGQVSECEVAALLELAQAESVFVLDTAATYGESEAALGRQLRPNHTFRIVTKTVPIAAPCIRNADVQSVADAFERSLERLKTDRVDALLIHHASELTRPGGEVLTAWLRDIRRNGLAAKIGVSCYSVAELAAASKVLVADIVQLPCSVLDRRFLESGQCAALKAAGAEVHARSVFLQGLMLMPPERLPDRFAPFRSCFERLDRYAADHGMTRIELALGFISRQAAIDIAVIGVTSTQELRDVVAAARAAETATADYEGLECADEWLLNPGLWSTPPILAEARAAR